MVGVLSSSLSKSTKNCYLHTHMQVYIHAHRYILDLMTANGAFQAIIVPVSDSICALAKLILIIILQLLGATLIEVP